MNTQNSDTQNSDILKLRPSNSRTVMLLAAMIVWFLLGASRYFAVGGILWLGLTLVGLAGAVVYGLMLLPGSSYLEASAERLIISTAFRKRSYAWAEIESFYVETILSRRVVKYLLLLTENADDQPEDMTEDGTRSKRTREETLPDTYGLSPDELADQLNVYRRRYQ